MLIFCPDWCVCVMYGFFNCYQKHYCDCICDWQWYWSEIKSIYLVLLLNQIILQFTRAGQTAWKPIIRHRRGSVMKSTWNIPSSPQSIGHSIRSQSSHHDELLQGAFPFPLLRKRLFLRTFRLHQLLPALRRAFNVPIKTSKVIRETHHLSKCREVLDNNIEQN